MVYNAGRLQIRLLRAIWEGRMGSGVFGCLLNKNAPTGKIGKNFITFARGKEVYKMSTEEKQVKVEQASKLAKWFKISIEISIFGQVIFSKTWPPQD